MRRLGWLLAFIFCFSALLSFVPSVASAQSTPPAATPAPAGNAGCGLSVTCLFFGNPANLKGNVQAAQAEVHGMKCWGCQIFNAFGSVVFVNGTDAAKSGDKYLKPVIVSVATLFALFYLGSAFVSGDGSDLLSRWKVFWRLCIAVAVGTAWMSGAGSFQNTWTYVYGPLLSIPLSVEQSVSRGSSAASSGSCNPAPAVPQSAPAGSADVMNEMGAVVCGANNIAMDGIGIGIGIANTGDGLVGSMINAVCGLIVMMVFGWITISFPMRFIDVLIRLAVVSIVTPVLVVCAVFKPTRSYVQLGIKNVLYAGCLFAFTGIMFKLGNSFMMEMIDINQVGGDATAETQLVRGIVLIGAAVIFSAMVKMAGPLAAEFSSFSGSSGGVGDAATGFSSTIVTAPAKAAGLAAGGIGAGVAARGAAGAVGRAAGAAGAEAGMAASKEAASKGVASGVTS